MDDITKRSQIPYLGRVFGGLNIVRAQNDHAHKFVNGAPISTRAHCKPLGVEQDNDRILGEFVIVEGATADCVVKVYRHTHI